MPGGMLVNLLLALACVSCVIAIGRARPRYAEGDQPALFCALLGFAAPAAAAAVAAVQPGNDPDWRAATLWLEQATTFLALPLLGVVALTLGRRWTWSRPNWGRVILGLCAFFELFRQLNQLDDYRLLLSLASLLLVLYAGALQWPQRLPLALAGGAVGLFLLAAYAAGGDGLVASMQRIDLLHGLLIPAYPLLAWLLLSLPGNRRTENPVKTL
ncbi:MAG: hypothetical protein KJ884_19710 [Gammaproteobacteria bacterium]|nr:hypothetical protein [Gammaproteobacteria bacterium]MBU1490772.1 hypothetical protein [Gammaproteobacteria bacterium]MBU2065548.1 hypothetical protein [Gammaproteobacteria bacterium]MBU2140803.1 hypothetical protein [Gammaproteobacteria bacterium]MBU2217692.1 hypothetical protein [Gammaproteobacteria bacterium]